MSPTSITIGCVQDGPAAGSGDPTTCAHVVKSVVAPSAVAPTVDVADFVSPVAHDGKGLCVDVATSNVTEESVDITCETFITSGNEIPSHVYDAPAPTPSASTKNCVSRVFDFFDV